jgi:hypothetical protein
LLAIINANLFPVVVLLVFNFIENVVGFENVSTCGTLDAFAWDHQASNYLGLSRGVQSLAHLEKVPSLQLIETAIYLSYDYPLLVEDETSHQSINKTRR